MKVAVVGSRSIVSLHEVEEAVRKSGFTVREVVSGGARGVDSSAKILADMHATPYTEFPAKWRKHGRGAGFIRNAQMVDYADAVVAVWDGKSRGTAHTIRLARERGKPVHVRIVED